MIKLGRAVSAWDTPAFRDILQAEIEQLDVHQLPLQQGLSQSSYALDDNIRVIIMRVAGDAGVIHATAGIFYTGVIPGCSCADDPSPEHEYAEYCEVRLDINRQTAETVIRLLND